MNRIHAGILLVCMVLLSFLGACNSREDQYKSSVAQINDEIRDSIYTRNFAFVEELVRRQKEQARDSDEYYNYVLQGTLVYFYTSQYDLLLDSVNKSIRYLTAQPFSRVRNRLLIKSMQAKGLYYTQYRFNADSMIYYQQEACRYAEREPMIEERLLCYANLADAYKFNGELVKSIDTYREAIAVADSMQVAPESCLPLYSGLAAAYTTLHDFEQSTIWWDKCAVFYDEMMAYDKFTYLNSRGNDYFYQGDYPQALEVFLRLDAFLRDYPDMVWERHFCWANLSDVYLKLHELDKARPLLEESIAYFGEENYSDMVLDYLHTQQMDLAMQEGDFNQVDRLIEKYPLSKDVRSEQKLLRLDFLWQYYSKKLDWKRAFDNGAAYAMLVDSVRSAQVKLKTAETRMRYERDATILNQRVVISSKEAKLMRLYAYLIAAIFIVLGLITFVLHRQKRVRWREKQMLRRIAKMKMENVRNRISPHFIYNALNHELLARQEGRPSSLNTLVDLLRQEQSLVSTFCTTLREELDFIDLYVKVEGESLGDNLNYEVLIDDSIDPAKVCLPSMMVQIFVENAFKHGLKILPRETAKRLTVRVFRQEDTTCVEVCNNGPLPIVRDSDDKVHIGLRVISQIILLLNAHNKRAMSYSLDGYHTLDGGTGCCASLVIPDKYNFDIND